jgi:acyl-CoA thioesterase YciA
MTQADDNPLPNGQLSLRIIPKAADTNASGDISGGWVLAQMDTAAEDAARKIARGKVVMVACEQTQFIAPVKIGGALCCYTRVGEVGKSSVQVYVEVWTQSPTDQSRRKVCDTQFVYVAVDDGGRIRAVPK